MENKNNYLKAFIRNKGKLNEMDLGESIGLDDHETEVIIAELLSEYKIEYIETRNCNYSLTKTLKRQ